MTERYWLRITDDVSLRSLEVPEQEPDTKSRTVKGGDAWVFGSGEVGSDAFAMDGLFYLLVLEF